MPLGIFWPLVFVVSHLVPALAQAAISLPTAQAHRGQERDHKTPLLELATAANELSLGSSHSPSVCAIPASSRKPLTNSNLEKENSRWVLMASLGDSITAATLADFPIPETPSNEASVQEWRKSSIESEIIFQNKWRYSWASGRFIDSQFLRLRQALKQSGDKRSLDILNVAFPGDRTKDLIRQAEQVADTMASGQYAVLKYVTILIGSNDACAGDGGIPLNQMRANLLQTFRILSQIEQNEPIRILLVGIPRIPDLGAPYLRKRETVFGATCETVRNRWLNFCNSLLLWENEQEYDEAMRIVEDRNRLLQDLALEASTRFPKLEVVYSNRLYNLEIPPEILAVDCFHPGKEGQRRIAEELWLDQPWFKADTRGMEPVPPPSPSPEPALTPTLTPTRPSAPLSAQAATQTSDQTSTNQKRKVRDQMRNHHTKTGGAR